ncbi:MAG: hypothetical protein HRT66_10910 [Flavobacteriaceae bacterium]|nr:hypothetical protein [Flavobacteriaceae bacterium]
MKKLIIILIVFLSLKTQSQETIISQDIKIDGYVTSGYSSSGFTNLFDDNLYTSWKLPADNVQNEGIFMSIEGGIEFKDKTKLVIHLDFNDITDIDNIEIKLYLDGVPTDYEINNNNNTYSIIVSNYSYNRELGSFEKIDDITNIYIKLIAKEVKRFVKRINYNKAGKRRSEKIYTRYKKPVYISIKEISIEALPLEYVKNPEVKIEYKIKHIQLLKAKLKATSTLSNKLAYDVINMFDSRNSTGWAEGNKNSGETEGFTIDFEEERIWAGMLINNGYQRSEKHYDANARAKDVSIFIDGKEIKKKLKDFNGKQTINFMPTKGTNIKLVVNSVYAGTKYKDLVISEITLIDNEGNYIKPISNKLDKIKKELKTKTNNTILEKYIDKHNNTNYTYNYDNFGNINEHSIEYDEDIHKGKHETTKEISLKLRSDYSFVYYNNISEKIFTKDDNCFGKDRCNKEHVLIDEELKEIIADGNWEIKSLTKDKAVIRVFGKHRVVSLYGTEYGTVSTGSNEHIFQDYLIITDKTIKGGKFIEDIIKITKNERIDK